MRRQSYESTGGGGGGGGDDDNDDDDNDVYAMIGTVCYILCFLVCCIPSHHLLVWLEQKQIYGQGCAYCLNLLQLCGGPWNSVGLKAVCSISLTQDHSQSTPGPLQGTRP